MPELPTGTVTFLFTDVEGSSRLWEREPDAMGQALARHDQLIEEHVAGYHGVVVRPRGEGDSRFAVFARASDAVAAAAAIQVALHTQDWLTETPLRVRMALHTGEAGLRDGDYYGSAVNRCARLRAIAHGGQALLSLTTEELVRDALPAGVRLADVGDHRLSDLTRPVRVFQLLHPDLPADFPPLRTLDTLPNNLPLQLTSFVGRVRELEELKTALTGARLMTLTGVGGCGKTRLALHVAADVLDAYPDGVWLVELAPIGDPALVPQTVATAAGIREALGQPILETLLHSWRTKRLLLLLDNCEHLLDACASFADALLRRCPDLRILTSREELGIAGEVPRRVPSLALPDVHQPPTVTTLAQSDAVRLFVDRAQIVQPTFSLTSKNAVPVAQVCRRLDGIPLALELAAARLQGLTVEQLATRLDQRFRLLTGGSRTALPRQQTLRALIDWSYDLLSEQERTLFRRLSVFVDGWTLEAPEAVCTGAGMARDEVLEVLLRLVARSLVVAEEVSDGHERYRLLETLRQYGHERLAASGEAEAIRAQHATYYLALAEEAEPQLVRREQLEWLDRLETEHDNLRAALRWSLGGGDVQAGLRAAGALEQFWWHRAHMVEADGWLAELLAAPGAATWTAARAKPQALAGMIMYNFHDWQGGRALLEESLAMARQVGAPATGAYALQWLGAIAYQRGADVALGRRLKEEGLARYRELGDLWGIAESLIHYARLEGWAGDHARARELLAEALATARRSGDRRHMGFTCEVLGELAAAEGRDTEAQGAWEQSLGAYREVGDWAGIASIRSFQGRLAVQRGDAEAARAYYLDCLTQTRGRGGWRLPEVMDGLAMLAAAQGEPAPAVRLAGASAAMRRAGYWYPTPEEQERSDRALSGSRQALGEAAAAAVWADGQALTLDEAFDLAVSVASGERAATADLHT